MKIYTPPFARLFKECNWEIQYQEKGDKVNYAFAEEGETLYIFFQPSRGKADWRNNFSYWRKPYKDMKVRYRVHGGFLKCWKTIKDEIIEKVRDPKWKQVLVIGYSHGAALAALCHECVWFERPDLRDHMLGIGFEGPRIYGGLWVKKALRERWDKFYMTRNGKDIVTHVPFKGMFFSHVGHLVKIGSCKGIIKPHYPEEVLKALEIFDNRLEAKWIRGLL